MHDRSSPSGRAAARDLATGAGTAALALLLAACAGAAAGLPRAEAALEAPARPGDTLRQPVEVRSERGVLDVELHVVEAVLPVPDSLGKPQPQRLRAYRLAAIRGVPVNYAPSFPGPTFRVQLGDSIRILLRNLLPPSSEADCLPYPAFTAGIDRAPNCFHGPNYTNIHFHGFHVSPSKPADDVLMQIAPGESFQYAFRLHPEQAPGTHWYHPHKHGSVALQVSNGMSGAFIIEGGSLDRMLLDMRVEDQLLAVQMVDSQLNLVGADPGAQLLINGQFRPRVQMRPGEVQRWRLVNENITRKANFQIGFIGVDPRDRPLMYDIGRDGVPYSPNNYNFDEPDTLFLMAPGNRLDVLVKAPARAGIYGLRSESVALPEAGSRQLPLGTTPPRDTLFYLEVVDDGRPVQTQFPRALPPLPAFLGNLRGPIERNALLRDTARMPTVVFVDSIPAGRSPQNPSQFWLGSAQEPRQRFSDRVFIPRRQNADWAPMLRDSIQTWRVMNYGTTTNHPFHIHINPFQVLYVHYPRGTADPNADLYFTLNRASQVHGAPVWMDVLALPLPSRTDPRDAGYVVIRQQYRNFTGAFVMHCHILGHEERGMMQKLVVYPTLRDAQEAMARGDAGGHADHAGHAHHH